MVLLTRHFMRFAYIDSNGNEVPIPSVDALALRIELGAISDDTQLYDAQADQWGPAHTHEIYHSLSRSSGSDEGFIAPPPVAPPPASPPVASPGSEPEGPEEEAVASDDGDDPGLTPAGPPEAEEAEEVSMLDLAPAAPDAKEDFGLTLADPSPPTEEGDESAALDFGGMDLAAQGDDASSGMAEGAAETEEALAPNFDFGGMDGSLELEETFSAPDEGVMDFGAPPTGAESGVDEGMGLETPMEFESGGFEMDSGDALDLEKPMSEFTPEAPPAWMDSEGADDSGGEVLDFSSIGDSESAEVPLRDRRTPKNKPSPPRLRRSRSFTAPLIGLVIVVAVAVGGYAAWPVVKARLGGSDEPEVPAVFIPTISAELMPQMRSAAEGALAATFEDARREWSDGGAVQSPPRDWLAGVYLANASNYEVAATFWEGMNDYLDLVRAIDVSAFDAAYGQGMSSRGVAQADADAMRERADSGFVAAAPARAEIFDRFQALADAALRLHRFLVANEANIQHVPANAMTTDPVLEVKPANEEIGNAMGDLLDSVTGALGSLGYRDQVTAEGLRVRLLAQIQESGIR